MIFDLDPTELSTQAAIGVGAVLLQLVDGKMSIEAYFSKQTTADQCRYSYELER